MVVIAKFNALLTIYWIFIFSRFYFVSEAKPSCTGDPLDPEKFSNEEDVGFLRDVCVDVVARNLYNHLGIPVSSLCEELANMRTSTCFCSCFKWKRLSFWNKGATNLVMSRAVALMDDFIEFASQDISLNIDEKFIFECLDDARRRLVKSGAAAEDSYLVGQLEDLQNFLCTRCLSALKKYLSCWYSSTSHIFPCTSLDQLNSYQYINQRTYGRLDPQVLKRLAYLMGNDDLVSAIKQFIRNFQATNKVQILNYYLDDSTGNAHSNLLTGVNRLKFTYVKGTDIRSSSVILKVPSLGARQNKKPEENIMFDREKYIYQRLLPELYRLGECEPFAPILHATNKAKALVLEDLSEDGFKHLAKQFDVDHCRITLNMLATYHALSHKYFQNLNRDDPCMSLIGSIQPTLSNEIEKKDFDRICNAVKPSISNLLYQKLLNAESKILADSKNRNLPRANSMTVIIHGDMHSRNIFFKYDDESKVSQCKMIDFQFAREASPVQDLIEFFILNVPYEIFEANGDDLLDSYVAAFNQKLSRISENRRYNRQELNDDIAYYSYIFFKIFSSLCQAVEQIIRMYGESYATNNPIVSDIVAWMGYLDKKGFI